MRRLLKALHDPIYASRIRILVDLILPQLQPEDEVLDVGCGFGALGRAIKDDPRCPSGVSVRGLESSARDASLIEIDTYDGERFPYADRQYDVVLLADVLHHEADPTRLFRESVRVSRRLVIVKDHKLDGPLARWRVSFLDWAANLPYDVPCLYRYNDLAQWRAWYRPHGLQLEREYTSLTLYPPVVNLLFGGRLHYLAVYRRPPRADAASEARGRVHATDSP